uniref:ElaC ribonuclease Z 1 n=1 Tax=Leptobrachium leishanense TaxID=445787 RepID=A0A8C5LWQ3_9ANUR
MILQKWYRHQFQAVVTFSGRITKIFITHLHGDHMFGLPGFLCTVSLQCSSTVTKQPVDIYGPVGLRDFVWRSLEISHSQLAFPYVVHELVPSEDQCPAEEFKDWSRTGIGDERIPADIQGRTVCEDPEGGSYTLFENDQFTVKAFKLFHRIPSFGFVIHEQERLGKLDVKKLRDFGIQPGPVCGKLKLGASVTLDNGQIVSPSDVLGDPIPGRKVCILGDCSGVISAEAARLCHEADVLVHEATLDDTQMDKAKEHGHSTPKMAAEFAGLCRARKLVLTHFSQRYKPAGMVGDGDEDVSVLKIQAEHHLVGRDVVLAEDFLTINIPIKKTD